MEVDGIDSNDLKDTESVDDCLIEDDSDQPEEQKEPSIPTREPLLRPELEYLSDAYRIFLDKEIKYVPSPYRQGNGYLTKQVYLFYIISYASISLVFLYLNKD